MDCSLELLLSLEDEDADERYVEGWKSVSKDIIVSKLNQTAEYTWMNWSTDVRWSGKRKLILRKQNNNVRIFATLPKM